MSEPLPLPPFQAFLASNIPSVYDNTLSYYDELTKLIAYLEQVVVPAVDATASEVDGIKKGLEELKSYVDHYFENLDVQEEINNKLDDMAESGQLATIIDQFVNLGVLFTYDTLADLIAAENLIAGCSCRTLGKETINDGCGAIYKIAAEGDIELDSGLYATLEDNTTGDNYYNEITMTYGRANNADYYVATIPLNDANGDLIPCYVNEDDTETTTPLTYAGKAATTITINAGLGRQDSQDLWKQGAVIANGVVLHEDLCDIPAPERYGYLGIKADRSVENYSSDTTAAAMLADGVENAFLTLGQIITNGSITIDEYYDPDLVNPWVHMGVKNDGTFVILSTDGRTAHDPGMTLQQSAGFMLALGCVNAWRCDAGGSSSLIYKGSKQNRNIDDNGTTERAIYVTLNFKKETNEKQIANTYANTGCGRQLLNKQIREDAESTYEKKRAFSNFFAVSTGINTIATADTWTNLQLQDSLSHNRAGVYDLIKNADNRTIGIKILKTGIYEIQINAVIQCANTDGERGLRIDGPLGTAISTHASSTSVFYPEAGSVGFEKNLITSFNVSTANKEVYFCGRGQVGDDFNRLNIIVREIGIPN